MLEGLYVGSLVDCRDQDNLEAVGITHVLSLLGTRVREESPQYEKLLLHFPLTLLSYLLYLYLLPYYIELSSHEIEIVARFRYLWINVKDEPTTLLAPHFGECIEFIHRARSQGG